MTENLKVLRKKINRLDKSIIKSLGYRMDVVRRIGKYKKMQDIPAYDKKRQEEVIKLRVKQGRKIGLDSKFINKLYTLVFEEALRIQKRGK